LQRHVQPPGITKFEEVRELRASAEAIEATYGPNPYSDYLRRHGRLPDPVTAAGIGRYLGGRVKADDGSMQPTRKARV
jgi:hypothetical protein